MAPEQVTDARNVDTRADIWAVGACIYFMLTGAYPFEASTIVAACLMVMRDPPTPITTYRRDLPRALVDVVMQCLEKDPGDRPQTAADLSKRLSACLEIASMNSHQVAPVTDPPKRSTWWIGAIAAIAMGVIGAFVLRPSSSPKEEAAVVSSAQPVHAILPVPTGSSPAAHAASVTIDADDLRTTRDPPSRARTASPRAPARAPTVRTSATAGPPAAPPSPSPPRDLYDKY